MNQMISFLEALGQNPNLAVMDAVGLQRMMSEMEIMDAKRNTLNALGQAVDTLAATTSMHMATIIWAPGEDPYSRPGDELPGDFIPLDQYQGESTGR